MRIISSFHDYYDNGLAYGSDPKLIYVRESKEIDVSPLTTLEKEKSIYKDIYVCIHSMPEYQNNCGVIAFCGKLYPFYEISYRYDSITGKCKYKYFYSFESMANYIYSNKFIEAITNDCTSNGGATAKNIDAAKYYITTIKKSIDEVINRKKYMWSNRMLYHEHDAQFIGKVINDEPFIKIDSPIIVFTISSGKPRKMVINSRLNEYNFIQKFDPISCFQEIEMYIGNNLAKQVDPSVNFSDELKRDIAGFDEWSFRKQSKKKK